MKYFLEPTDIEDGIIFPQKKKITQAQINS